jgi:hypothetical protein
MLRYAALLFVSINNIHYKIEILNTLNINFNMCPILSAFYAFLCHFTFLYCLKFHNRPKFHKEK